MNGNLHINVNENIKGLLGASKTCFHSHFMQISMSFYERQIKQQMLYTANPFKRAVQLFF